MLTVIVSPVFPPDPSSAAMYTKLLAAGLSDDTDTQVVTFGTIPERIGDTQVHTVSKRTNKLTRALRCAKQILNLKPSTIIVQNGPSSELSVALATLFSQATIIYIISDHDAYHTDSRTSKWLKRCITQKAVTTITLPAESSNYLQPEWLPYDPSLQTAELAHKKWWEEHIVNIKQYVQK